MGSGQATLDLFGPDDDTAVSKPALPAIGHWTTKGTLDLLENTPASKPSAAPMSQLEAAKLGFKTGASSNWYPEFKGVSEASGLPHDLGGFRAPVGGVKLISEAPELGGTPGEATEAYYKARNEARAEVNAAYEQYPMTASGADLAGGFLQPTSRMRPATIGQRVLQNAATQGVMGAVRGASDGGGVTGAVAGGVIGAGLGGPIGALGVQPRAPVGPNAAVEANTRLNAGAPVGLLTDNPSLNRIYQAGREIPLIGNLPLIGPERPIRRALGTMESTANDISTHLGPLIDPADKNAVGSGLKTGMATTLDFNTDKAHAEFDNLRREFRPNQEVPAPQGVINQLNQIVHDRTARGETGQLTGQLNNINELLRRPQGSTWEGMRQARSVLGKAITWDSIKNGGVDEIDLRSAHRALTDAMEHNVRQTARGNPDRAVELWGDANFAHQQKMDENSELAKLISKGSAEDLTNKALKWASAKGGDFDSLRNLHSAVSQPEWDNLAAHTTHIMGRNGQSPWSPNLFASKYEALSDGARNLLYGAQGPVRHAMDDIATLSRRFANVGQLENRSHSGGALMTGGMVGSALEGHNPLSMAFGHWDKVLGVGAAAFLLTRPATAESMARATRLYATLTESPRVIGGRAMNAVAQDLSAKIGKTLGINVPPSALIPPMNQQNDGK